MEVCLVTGYECLCKESKWGKIQKSLFKNMTRFSIATFVYVLVLNSISFMLAPMKM